MPFSPAYGNNNRQRYSDISPYEQPSVGADGKLDRLEKIVEKQQGEIEFLRAKLHEVTTSGSGMGTPVQVPPGAVYYPPPGAVPYPPYPPQVYYNSPPSFVPPPPGYHPALPGVIRTSRVNGDEPPEMMRPSSAAAAFADRYHGYANEDDDDFRRNDYWAPVGNGSNNMQNFRPQSAMDRWGEGERDFSYTNQRSIDDSQQRIRNPFESSTASSSRDRIRFNDPSTFFEQKPTRDELLHFGGKTFGNQQPGQRPALLPNPIGIPRYGQENEWKTDRKPAAGRGAGNFRGSGFRGAMRGAMRGGAIPQNFGTLGQQARDSLGIMKDSGYPRSSSPNDDFSMDSSDSTNKGSSLEPKHVTNSTTGYPSGPYGTTLAPPQPQRKLKGFVDDSFMSQQDDQATANNKLVKVVSATVPQPAPVPIVKPEPRPPSILKNGEIVDDSFDSQNSNGNNHKSVTFKFDQEVAAALNRGRSPFPPGEKTPSPTSSASSGTSDILSISMLNPSDFNEPNMRGQVVHVVSPDEFYVVIHESEELAEALRGYVSSKKTRRIFDGSSLREGEMCVVNFTDGCWYRGSVTYPGKNPEILLIDYGDTVTVKDPVQDYLRVYDVSLSKWPVQGAIAQLADVAPPGRSENWPETSIAEFKRLVNEVVFNVELVDIESVPPTVRLVGEDSGVDISAALIEDAFAKKK